ncbi:MAG: GGDEF domain-containing protein [Oscillospiraceae bacterium]|nr:GGDEF domain-containing protein [Oscillospiraceae bacterium]
MLKKISSDHIFTNAKKITLITVIVYVIVKQLFFLGFVDSVYWMPRGCIHLAMVGITVVLICTNKLTRKQLSWIIPGSLSLLELIGSVLTGGDQMIYIALVGCTLLSLLYADNLGLAVTAIFNSLGLLFCIFFFDFAKILTDLYHYSGVVMLNGLIYLFGRYIVGEIFRSQKELEQKADEVYYDALTGIHNRRYLYEELDRLIKFLSRSDGMLSLMIVDIDFFKQYNDTYGHVKGDKCLKIVAETLAADTTRSGDFVARYGGDEFVVVLPNTDKNGMYTVAEKIITSISDLKIPHQSSEVAEHVTVSIGSITGKARHTRRSDDYMKKADEMLYTSKQNGRNQYTFGEY